MQGGGRAAAYALTSALGTVLSVSAAMAAACLARVVSPLFLIASAASASSPAAIAAAGDTVVVTVGSSALAAPVATNFASFSMEVPDGMLFMGPPGAPNTAFANLMNVLRNVSGGRGPSVRIGGNSADGSLYWESADPLPPNCSYAITRADLQSYAAALPLWDGRAVIDTNFFLQNDTARISAHVAAVTQYMGWERIEGVEVGNEVEIYHDDGYRPQAWTEQDYEVEWLAHVAAAEAAGMPHGRIQGAVFCCNNTAYNAAFAGYAARYSAKGLLASMSYHHYSLGGCEGKVVTLAELLADGASVGAAKYLAPFAAASRAAGVPFRVGEGNSASCGGRDNVSNVFGTALWALDTLLAVAEVGVEQWNFHGGPKARDNYTPISFPGLPASLVPDVRPLYYGMLAATYATANASAPWAATVQSTNALIKAHALRDARGVTRVVVTHKDLAASVAAAVTVDPGAAAASAAGGALYRLVVAGNDALAKTGVSFAGQTFDGSVDGLPVGEQRTEAVPLVGGTFSFLLPPRSAALLVFSA